MNAVVPETSRGNGIPFPLPERDELKRQFRRLCALSREFECRPIHQHGSPEGFETGCDANFVAYPVLKRLARGKNQSFRMNPFERPWRRGNDRRQIPQSRAANFRQSRHRLRKMQNGFAPARNWRDEMIDRQDVVERQELVQVPARRRIKSDRTCGERSGTSRRSEKDECGDASEQESHSSRSQTPVEPNPPAPLDVSDKSAVSTISA